MEQKISMEKLQVVFVCIENANRSQMAEAFAKMIFSDTVDAYSAGSKAVGKLNSRAVESMKKVDYDLKKHQSKSLNKLPDQEWDIVVGMGCKDNCPSLKAKKRVEWDIPDPKNMNETDFDQVRKLIKHRVQTLLR